MFRIKKPHIYREQDGAGQWSWAYKPGNFWLNHKTLQFVSMMNWGWRPGRKWR